MMIPAENITASSEKYSFRWLRNSLLILIAVFLVWQILPPLKGIIIMFVVALLFAYLLEPLVSDLENRGVPRTYSIALLYLAIGVVLYVVGFFLYEPIKNQILNLIETIQQGNITTLTDKIESFLLTNFSTISEEQIKAAMAEMTARFQNEVLDITTLLLSYIMDVFSLITQIIIVPLIAFFLLKDGPKLKREIIGLIPNKFFEMSLHLIHKTDIQIGRYIRGQLLDTLLLAILYSIGFKLLGIPYYYVLGAFSGIANIIPYVGPIFAAVPPIIVPIIKTGSFDLVPITIALFVVVQVIEVVFIQPTVVAKSVNVHPLILIFAVLAGGQVLGIIGMLFAVLLAGVIKVIIVEIAWSYRHYHLNRG